MDCHECRFCCSLPLCAMNTSQGKDYIINFLDNRNKKHHIKFAALVMTISFRTIFLLLQVNYTVDTNFHKRNNVK
jgi:hypothetical protein